MASLYRLAFNAGELAPELTWRNDLAKYQNGCRHLENFLVTPYGAVRRRPGTAVMRTLSGLDPVYPVWMHSFAATNGTRFAVIVGVVKTADAVVDDDTGLTTTPAVYETRLYVVNDATDLANDATTAGGHVFALAPAPWPLDSLALIQAVQVNDVLFFAHPSVRPKRLEHRDTGWTFIDQDTFGGPFLDGEEDSRTVSMTFLQDNDPIRTYSSSTTYNLGDYVWFTSHSRKSLYRSKYATGQSNHSPSATSSSAYWEKAAAFTKDGTRNTVKLTFSAAVFTGTLADWGGTPWAILLNDSAGAITANWITGQDQGSEGAVGEDVDAGETSIPMLVNGVVSLSTNGTWGGEIALEESTDGGLTWEELGTIVSNASAPYNGSMEREVTARTSLVRVKLKSRTMAARPFIDATTKAALVADDALPPCDTGCAITLKRVGEVWVYGTILSVTSATVAVFEPASPVTEEITVSPRWSEGLFSDRNGYPRAMTVHQERLWFGGNSKRPQSVWASAINDWGDFRLGTLATSAMAFTLAADRLNAIRWLRSGKALMIGTDSGEWTLAEMNKQEALTSSNVQVTRHTEYGSAEIAACAMADVMVFVQRNSRRLRSMVYSYEADGFTSPDLSMLGKHLLTQGVMQLAFQRHPDPILWCLLADGTLASFTYDRDNDVLGWARHAIRGANQAATVVAIAAQPGETDDELWLLVRDAAGVVSLCAMRPLLDDVGNEQHLDLATKEAGSVVWDGHEYPSVLEPTGMAAPDGQPGKRSRIAGVRLFVQDSRGGEVSADGGKTWETVRVQAPNVPFGDIPAVSGQQKIRCNSGWGDDVNVIIRSSGPHPLTVCALGIEFERGEA